MRFETFSLEKRDRWWDYFERIESKGIYHQPDYISFLEKHYYKGSKAELFIFEEKDKFVYYPYFKRSLDKLALKTQEIDLEKYCDIIASWYYGGPLLNSSRGVIEGKQIVEKFLNEFRNYCRNNNIVSEFIRLDPLLKNGDYLGHFLDKKFYTEIVYVNLDKNEEEIWKNFDKRNRTSIRKAMKSGVEIKKDDSDEAIEKFVEVYQSEMKRKNAPEHYWFDIDSIKDMRDMLKGKFNLFLAKIDGKVIGGGICAREGGVAHDYLAATLPEYWKYQPNNLLLFEELKWCKSQGDRIYDLQGGRPAVLKFKSAFSGDRSNYYTASIIHNGKTYDKLVNLAKEDNKEEIKEGNFPLYRKSGSR